MGLIIDVAVVSISVYFVSIIIIVEFDLLANKLFDACDGRLCVVILVR